VINFTFQISIEYPVNNLKGAGALLQEEGWHVRWSDHALLHPMQR